MRPHIRLTYAKIDSNDDERYFARKVCRKHQLSSKILIPIACTFCSQENLEQKTDRNRTHNGTLTENRLIHANQNQNRTRSGNYKVNRCDLTSCTFTNQMAINGQITCFNRNPRRMSQNHLHLCAG